MDPFLDPCLVVNRGIAFRQSPQAVDSARDFIGSVRAGDGMGAAREIVGRVHRRLRVLPSVLGIGAPRTLEEIIARRGGNCISYSALTTVVLRSHGLPARLVVEDVYTDFSVLRAPGALIRAPIGPTLNGHVWLEVLIDGQWTPADAELGLLGDERWLSARLGKGATLAALGIPVTEHWRFPLRIRRLAADGAPEEDATMPYLIDKPAARLSLPELPAAWIDGVRYFKDSFRWDGRSGLRLLGERKRLGTMFDALGVFRGALIS